MKALFILLSHCFVATAFTQRQAFFLVQLSVSPVITNSGIITSNAWENPDNWDCHQVPDKYTDVIINTDVANTPVINNDATCRSLSVTPGAGIRVNAGFNFKIKGK